MEFHVTSLVSSDAERTIEPEAVALGVFGGIAALAALFIAAQAIGRLLRVRDDDLAVLRAVGADPMTTTLDGLIGILGAVVLGAIVCAVGVASCAVAVRSHRSVRYVRDLPLREESPRTGQRCSESGSQCSSGGLGAITVVPSRSCRDATPHRRLTTCRAPLEGQHDSWRPPTCLRRPSPRLAFRRRARARSESSVPVRTVLLATVLAVVMVVATLTFGDGLSTLASTPRLYGWNWSYAIQASAGYGDVPLTEVQGLLAENHLVVGAAELAFVSIELDGQTVPVMFGRPDATVAPEILSGHGLQAENQIVLGSATLAALHKQVGDTIYASYGTPKDKPSYIPRTAIRIVGTATMPAIQDATGPACVDGNRRTGVVQPLRPRRRTELPGAVVGRCRSTSDRSAGRGGSRGDAKDDRCRGLDVRQPAVEQRLRRRIDRAARRAAPSGDRQLSLDGRPRPVCSPQALAVGAVAALGLTLAASVRRRRRDLALLKTLGFTQWQLATTRRVAGVVRGFRRRRGRHSARCRARQMAVDPVCPRDLRSPRSSGAIVVDRAGFGLGTLLFANIVAAVPGRMAAHTSTASVLRTE